MNAPAAVEVLRYQCGCLADAVGQAFEDGVMVCPEHRQILEPGPPRLGPWRGRIVATVELEVADRRTAERFLDDLTDEIVRRDYVKTSAVTIEELT